MSTPKKKATYKRKNYNYSRPDKSKHYYKYKAAKDERLSKEKEARRLRGPGFIASGGEMVGEGIGNFIGGTPGGVVGKFLGGKLGHLVEQITGFGDYTIHTNSIMKGGMTVPQVVNSHQKGGVIVRHREYIGPVLASTTFNCTSYLIQPGLPDAFPWLSTIANAFEQYKLRGMLFEFQSTSSDALLSSSTNTALGSVTMMTDYDVADAAPTSKREMLNSEFSCANKPSVSFIHPIECKRSVTPINMLYTRGSYAVPTGFDQRLYDFARFNIAVEGCQAGGGELGLLWCTYEIELFKSQFAYYGLADHFRMTAITNLLPLGTVVGSNKNAGGTIGGTISGNSLSYGFPLNISSGKYLMTYSVLGGGIANCHAPSLTFTNCVSLGLLSNDTFGNVYAPEPATATATTTYIITAVVQVTAPLAFINFSTTGVTPGATNYGDLWVTRLPDSIRGITP